MKKKRPPYSPEFRQKIVDLVRAGRTPEELAKEFEPHIQSIRNWVAQAGIEASPSVQDKSFITREERSELTQLRRENKILREEREILKKAAAWFAQVSASSVRRSDS